MPSFSGCSLSFGWFHFAVLLSIALFGLLLVGANLQNWFASSESLGYKQGNHRSLRTIVCLEDEYLNGKSETCHKCPPCSYGYKLNKACGNGLGENATCSQCISDYYQRDGECYPCKFCQGRDTLEKCTNTSNTKCSLECSQGYFMSVTKQCIQIRSKSQPALPLIIPEPTLPKLSTQGSTAAYKTRAIGTVSPSSILKVQNESNLELPFEEDTSVIEKESIESSSLKTIAYFLCVFLALVLFAGCVLKRSFSNSAAVLKAHIYRYCCCTKNKQPEKHEELTPPDNSSPGDSSVEGLEPQTNHPLLPNGEGDVRIHEEVVIIPDEIQDDAFPQEIETVEENFGSLLEVKTPAEDHIQNGGTDDSQMQNRGTAVQYEGEMQQRYAANVIFISRALAREDLESFKSYLCLATSNYFTENDKESADSFEKIVTVLQQRLLCSWSDTGILVNGLVSINRFDLAQKLEKLDKPEKNDPPRRLRRSSSRQD